MSAERTMSPHAFSSFKLGLLSLVLTFLTGVPAIVQGVRGLRQIRRDPDRLKGRSRAWAGIGTGLFGSVLGVWLLMVVIERVQDASDRVH
jgi:hypothetical protein